MRFSIAAAIMLMASSCLASPTSHEQQQPHSHSRRSSAATTVGYDYVNVTMVGAALASHSWEWGTMSETLQEVFGPALSVFAPGKTAFPSGQIPKRTPSAIRALSYAQPHITTNPSSHTLIADGAAGDPASLGIATIMVGQTNASYTQAAARQVNHLLYEVPRYSNGAISHREGYAELWADFMFMAPPFLTYYAVATNNKTLLKYTVAEIGRQRQILQLGGTTPYKGLWQHIVGPRAQSLGLWSTGNAWVLLGLVRVLATIQHWPNTAQWTENTAILRGYIYEILDGVVASKSNLDPANGLIRNYIVGGLNSYSDTSYKWFGEAAGTAGIAAAIYRMAVLDPGKGKNYVAFADSLRKAVAKTVGKDGVLRPVVNPYDWTDKNPSRTGSPEAQAFAGMLGASYLDYLGSKSS